MTKSILLILFALMITGCEESKIQPATDTDIEDNDTAIDLMKRWILADNDLIKKLTMRILSMMSMFIRPDWFLMFHSDENDETPDIDDASNEPCLSFADLMKTPTYQDQCKDFITVKG